MEKELDIKVELLTHAELEKMLETIGEVDDRELFGKIFRTLDWYSDMHLWGIMLVNFKVIYNDVFKASTYDEYLDVLFKHRKKLIT